MKRKKIFANVVNNIICMLVVKRFLRISSMLKTDAMCVNSVNS